MQVVVKALFLFPLCFVDPDPESLFSPRHITKDLKRRALSCINHYATKLLVSHDTTADLSSDEKSPLEGPSAGLEWLGTLSNQNRRSRRHSTSATIARGYSDHGTPLRTRRASSSAIMVSRSSTLIYLSSDPVRNSPKLRTSFPV